MAGGFKDHFSDASNDYRLYRPHYPAELFSYLAGLSPQRYCAWDCATGSGQSAVALSDYFSKVIATDASAAQIDSARLVDSPNSRNKICYRVARAEQSEIDKDSVDLIAVAQALHWFDIPAFALEADRVLKHGGMLAVWTYNLLEIQPVIDQQVNHLYASILGDYWPEERQMVENGYANISFPFNELKPPCFEMKAAWMLPQLLGYLHTWSALKRYQKERGVDPVESMMNEFLSSWGAPDSIRAVRWPLSLRVWKKN